MPIDIPTDATVVRDKKLTFLRILGDLTARKGRESEYKTRLKCAMAEKEAKFAQSDHVVARLQSAGGGGKRYVDPTQLYGLIKKGRISMEQFLSVLCVRTSLLPPLLSGKEIEAISKPAEADAGTEDPGTALFIEWLPGVTVDLDKIEKAMLDAFLKCVG